MPRQPAVPLTDAELRLMRVLWDRGEATVSDVREALEGRRKPAHNTVLTLLRILERKGIVRHVQAGRAFRFLPIVDRDGARRLAVRALMARFFDGSARDLARNLVEHGDLDVEQLRDLQRLADGAHPAQ